MHLYLYNADRAENQNLVSALSITINKILCQFFEFTQNLKRSLNDHTIQKPVNIRYMAVTAMLSAVAFILMFFEFSVPFMPAFVKLDLSELPALIGAFSMGPLCGVLVCLVKNLLHVLITTTGGVGELSNFVLGASFVLPAGFIYKRKKSRKTAIIGSLTGAVLMALISVVSNYFVMYPFYTAFLPMDEIIAMYQAIFPGVNGLLECLIVFNMPFTFLKGMISVVITFLIYKHISPVLKGKQR